MVNSLSPYNQTLFLLDAIIVLKVIIRSAVLALKLCLVTSTGIATNVLKSYNNRAQPTSLSLLLPPTPYHLNSCQLNLEINSIRQWNADGICPKLLELCDKIINSVSDIVATPESKLRKADKTPSIEGYSTIHKD